MSDIEKHGDGDPHIAEFELCHDPEEVLRIGRDFQRQDTFRGAQHDTVKLLCDTIEYLRDSLSKPVGSAAAMREALELVNEIYDLLSKPCIVIEEVRHECQKARALLIATPPRNCDVGTAEEQARRYKLFCENHSGWDGQKRFGCLNCPFIDVDECEFAWAQMPYEADEGGAK